MAKLGKPFRCPGCGTKRFLRSNFPCVFHCPICREYPVFVINDPGELCDYCHERLKCVSLGSIYKLCLDGVHRVTLIVDHLNVIKPSPHGGMVKVYFKKGGKHG